MSVRTPDAARRRASALMPGGVSSPVRSFGAVGAEPLHIERAEGCTLWDTEGRAYVDLIGGWGAAVLGHAHPEITRVIGARAALGCCPGLTSPGEIDLAERVVERVPSVESIRFVNSGTEAAMSAVRLARAATDRAVVIRFSGNYHGHADGLLGGAGSDGLVLAYNDAAALGEAFDRQGVRIAAVLVEPIAGNMGLVPPEPGFLEEARRLASEHGALLIFDEVMTGFRVHRGCAQSLLGVRPDLSVFGKVLGGGLPIGAYGGRRELMDRVTPSGPVYQAGTFSGNPLTMAAGSATLDLLTPSDYARLDALTRRLAAGLREVAAERGAHPLTVHDATGMVGLFFGVSRVRDRADAGEADHAGYARFFRAMLRCGVLIPPSGFEAWFVSLAHDEGTIDRVIEAASDAFAEVAAHRLEGRGIS